MIPQRREAAASSAATFSKSVFRAGEIDKEEFEGRRRF